MKRIIQKRIIPARTLSQNEKFSNQLTMWSTKVRSSHNICCLCSFLVELSSCRVVRSKTSINNRFFNLVWGQWMDLRNSNGFELRNFYFTNVKNLFPKIFIRSARGKMHHVELNSGTSESRKYKILLYVWRYWLTRVPCKVTWKTKRNSGSRLNLKVRSQYLRSFSEL